MTTDLHVQAQAISRYKKERFLRNYSEDDFRDAVIRPLFLRQGLTDGRDLCGPTEEGKDAIFLAVDQLGMDDVYAVQTKAGNLNLASAASHNLEVALTQLLTALATTYVFVATKEKRNASKVILCASGKINQSARAHITEKIRDARIVILDADDLIIKIDEFLPELWLGIDATATPYLRALGRILEDVTSESAAALGVPGNKDLQTAATDAMFVALRLIHRSWKPVKRKGRVEKEPHIEHIPLQGLLKRKQRQSLLVGEAGAGKSTCLRRLAYVLCRQDGSVTPPIVPVLLRAVDIGRSVSSVVDLCAQETKTVANSNSAAFSSDDIEDGRLVVLVDAIDELSDDLARTHVLDRIKQFCEVYPLCRVVVTSRNYTFLRHLPLLASYAEYQVAPITYHQAEQIIARVQSNRGLPPETSREVVRRLQDVHGLELNPLLVTVFAATSEDTRRDIPANITELFKKYTELMLGRWDSNKGLRQQYQAPLKDFVLTKVAFEIHRRRTTQLSVAEFRYLVRAELERRGHAADVDQLLDEILNRSGLLRVLGDQVEFRHLLIQEFFAGRGIPTLDALEPFLGDSWWQRTIVFFFGNKPDQGDELLRASEASVARTKPEQFLAAATLGLALQACYLVDVQQREAIFKWVLKTIATTKDAVIADIESQNHFPLTSFLVYYLSGRDSVACSLLSKTMASGAAWISENDASVDEQEVRRFWLIVGLLECGELVAAESLVHDFRPMDARYLLAIHLGCYLFQHVRVSSKAEKAAGKRISEKVADRVAGLREQLIVEVKSELLEIQKGKLTALPEPEES